MLEDVPELTLAVLNEATQAWVEHEYNRKLHSEIGEAPITRFLAGPDVTRPCPDSDTLRLAFTRSDHRTQRKSDGTIVIDGRRFEVPNRYRHLSRIEVRYAAGISASSTSSTSGPARRCRGSIPRTRPERQRPAPFARSGLLAPRRPTTSSRRPASRRCSPGCRPPGRYRTAAALSPEGRTRRRHVNKKMLALYGLKWNPFAPDVPVDIARQSG